MSIYCTLWQIQVEDERPRLPGWYPESSRWIEVCAQAVPAFIGHPSAYPDGDPYAEILPWPVVVGEDPEQEPDSRPWRAVFICAEGITTKGTSRSGQEYVNPLFVLTDDEYESVTWVEMLERIGDALRRQEPLRPRERENSEPGFVVSDRGGFTMWTMLLQGQPLPSQSRGHRDPDPGPL